MNICVTNWKMDDLTGAPLYAYELARALNKNHQVTLASGEWGFPGGETQILKDNLEAEGIKTTQLIPGNYDLVIASHWTAPEVIGNSPAIYVSHSEYPIEEPIEHPNIIAYVGIRESIKDKWEPRFTAAPWHVVGNPIDTERFKPVKKKYHSYYLTVTPCTTDELRKPFLTKLIERTNQYNRLRIVGHDRGAQLPLNEYVERKPPTFHIERELADANRVAGILLGRVNLEAASMGIHSIMFDPETLEETEFPAKLPDKYRAENVAKEIVSLLK